MYNLLVPLVAKTFREYVVPKTLVKLKGKAVVEWALDSIELSNCNLIFILHRSDIHNFGLDKFLKLKYPDCTIIETKHWEPDVPCCLEAKHLINSDPLVICHPNCYFQPKFDPSTVDSALDGLLLASEDGVHGYGFMETNNPIKYILNSTLNTAYRRASLGTYYFKNGSHFVSYGEKAIGTLRYPCKITDIFVLMIKDHAIIHSTDIPIVHRMGTMVDIRFFKDHAWRRFGEKPVVVASDHAGYKFKDKAKKILTKHKITINDVGCRTNDRCSYSKYAQNAAIEIQKNRAEYGFGFCHTGQGFNMCANKMDGILSALVYDDYTAQYAIRHNCANFFAVPTFYCDEDTFDSMVGVLKKATFEGGRHAMRLKDILSIDRYK